jgi:hypothetical protein
MIASARSHSQFATMMIRYIPTYTFCMHGVVPTRVHGFAQMLLCLVCVQEHATQLRSHQYDALHRPEPGVQRADSARDHPVCPARGAASGPLLRKGWRRQTAPRDDRQEPKGRSPEGVGMPHEDDAPHAGREGGPRGLRPGAAQARARNAGAHSIAHVCTVTQFDVYVKFKTDSTNCCACAWPRCSP